jgi:hypothetical protein
MSENGHNQAENQRLDRVERIIEAPAGRQELIEDEFGRLLKAQIVVVDSQQQLQEAHKRTDAALASFIEHAKMRDAETTDKLNALIELMDRHLKEHRGETQ